MSDFQLVAEPKKIKLGQYMPDLYPNGLPSNSIINKTLTGIRATTCELEANRHTIIIVPNVPVIDGKQRKHKEIFGVRQGIEIADIIDYLNNKRIKYKRILVTPESYHKVKTAIQNCKYNLFKDFFFTIDECEKLVQESSFRKDIIEPFFDFFEYDNKCMISATPLYPNLKGFVNHDLKIINIEPTYDYKKDLSLIVTNNVSKEVIKHIQNRKAQLAIFLNSLEYAKSIIKDAGIKEICKIYTTKGEAENLLKDNYKAAETFAPDEKLEEVSIFTSRYYSAVDLDIPEKLDIIMVTSCSYKPQTMIDPFTHAVQIPGRFRFGFGTLTHITNFSKKYTVSDRNKLLQGIKEEEEFYKSILSLDEAKAEGAKILLNKIEEHSVYARFGFKTGKYKGKLNPFLVECYLEQEKIKGLYSNPRLLEKAYNETKHFNVTYDYIQYPDSEKTEVKKLSRKRKVDILNRLKVLLPIEDNTSIIFRLQTENTEKELDALYEEAPILYKFYEKYGADKVIELDYQLPKMERELKKLYNEKQYLIPKDEIQETFILKRLYSESEITETLQRIYNEYGLKDYDNKPLSVKATFLDKYFELSTRMSIPNSKEKGYIPLLRLIL